MIHDLGFVQLDSIQVVARAHHHILWSRNQNYREPMLDKLLAYRVFSDDDGRMNLSVSDVNGGVLLVSQFTLAADTSKGLRPGFSTAALADEAEPLYQFMAAELRARNPRFTSGTFGANMQVHLVNDGPVTFLLQT